MKILSIDCETTGLDVNTCEVIELGFSLYDLSFSRETPVIVYSKLIIPKGEITDEITDVTGLTAKVLNQYGVQPDEAFFDLVNVMREHAPDVMLGHNLIDYDLPIISKYLDLIRDQVEVGYQPIMVDTRIDLPHKRPPKNNSLIFLSADIAKFCNPFSHRALFDALSTMKILTPYDIEKVVESARSPIVEIRADVSFSNKDFAKKAGYSWDGDRKMWGKKIRLSKVAEEKAKSNFPIIVLEQQKISKI